MREMYTLPSDLGEWPPTTIIPQTKKLNRGPGSRKNYNWLRLDGLSSVGWNESLNDKYLWLYFLNCFPPSSGTGVKYF